MLNQLPRLPNDFSDKAREVFAAEVAAEKAGKPNHFLTGASESGLLPGERVYVRDEAARSRRPKRQHNAVILGFTKPRGFAKVLTQEGLILLVHPDDCTRKCGRYACRNLATSGPNVSSHNWRYCSRCQTLINEAAGLILVPDAEDVL